MTPATYIRERREALNYTREDLAFHTMAMIRTYGADGVDPVSPWFLQEMEAGRIDLRGAPCVYLVALCAVLEFPIQELIACLALEWINSARRVPA